MSSKDWTRHEFKRGKAKMNHYANTRFNWGTEANVQSVHSYPAHLFGAFPLAQNLSYTFDFSQMTGVDKNCDHDHFCKNFHGIFTEVLRLNVGLQAVAEERNQRMRMESVINGRFSSSFIQTLL